MSRVMPHRQVIQFAAIALIILPIVGCVSGPTPPTTSPSTAASGEPNTAASGEQLREPTWTATGEMVVGRYDHAATLLADGRVLVAGGTGSDNEVLMSAELFDPETGSWSPTGDMLAGHTGHTATLLPDGRVLVVSDQGSELYDPDSGSWRATARVTTPSTATLLADGRVLVTAANASRARLYDPADDSWSLTAPMQTPRYNQVATLLRDGSVLVAGGDRVPDVGLVSAELYDPATESWIATGEIARPRTHTATLLPDGRVLDVGWSFGGGPFGELYDTHNRTWSSIEITVPLTGSAAAAPLLRDGSVLFVSFDGSTALYDSASASWATGPRMVPGRDQATVTLLTDGEVLVAGGVDGRLLGLERPTGVFLPALSSAELFDPGTGQ